MIEIGRPFYQPVFNGVRIRFFPPMGNAIQAPWTVLEDIFAASAVPWLSGKAALAALRSDFAHLLRNVRLGREWLTLANFRNAHEILGMLEEAGMLDEAGADAISREIQRAAELQLDIRFGHLSDPLHEQPEANGFWEACRRHNDETPRLELSDTKPPLNSVDDRRGQWQR